MRQEPADISRIDTSALPLHTALRVEITAAGVRQNDVAQRAGISETQLSHKLRGRKPISTDEAAAIRTAIDELKALIA